MLHMSLWYTEHVIMSHLLLLCKCRASKCVCLGLCVYGRVCVCVPAPVEWNTG